MKISDCCDSIPFNDQIEEVNGEFIGMCAECRDHCGFHDDIAEGNAEVGGSVGAEDSPQKFK